MLFPISLLIDFNERENRNPIAIPFVSLQDVKRDTCASRTGRIIRRIGAWKKGRGFRSCWGAHFRMHARSLSPLSHYLKLQSIDRRRDGAETCLCPTWSQYKQRVFQKSRYKDRASSCVTYRASTVTRCLLNVSLPSHGLFGALKLI